MFEKFQFMDGVWVGGSQNGLFDLWPIFFQCHGEMVTGWILEGVTCMQSIKRLSHVGQLVWYAVLVDQWNDRGTVWSASYLYWPYASTMFQNMTTFTKQFHWQNSVYQAFPHKLAYNLIHGSAMWLLLLDWHNKLTINHLFMTSPFITILPYCVYIQFYVLSLNVCTVHFIWKLSVRLQSQ